MRTRASRAGIGAAALAAALVLFFVLGRDRNPGPDATAQAGSAPGAAESLSDSRTTTEPESVPGESQSRSAPPQTPAKGRILVRDGSPVGGVRRLEYEKGERVRFSVRSDTADEVHVHGFDITKELPANRTVQFEFPADFEGVFDVELHHGNVEIAELRIRP